MNLTISCALEYLQRDAKYDPQLAAEALEWLKAIVGEGYCVSIGDSPDADSIVEALKNGQYLCKAINIIQPGSVPKYNTSKMAFKMVSELFMLNMLSVC